MRQPIIMTEHSRSMSSRPAAIPPIMPPTMAPTEPLPPPPPLLLLGAAPSEAGICMPPSCVATSATLSTFRPAHNVYVKSIGLSAESKVQLISNGRELCDAVLHGDQRDAVHVQTLLARRRQASGAAGPQAQLQEQQDHMHSFCSRRR